jgi:hypothetical protein
MFNLQVSPSGEVMLEESAQPRGYRAQAARLAATATGVVLAATDMAMRLRARVAPLMATSSDQ